MRADTRGKVEQVHAAICDLPSNGKTVTASIREIMKLTGGSRGSVERSRKLCVMDGRIEPTNNARTGIWLRAANSFKILRTTSIKPSYLWSGHGLGPTIGLIYNSMPKEQWLSTIQIADVAEVSTRTSRDSLRKLMSTGLIDCRENGQWRRFDDDDYFKRTEERLTGRSRKTLKRKVLEEQIEWKAIDDIFSQGRRQPRTGSAGTQPGHNTSGRP